MQTFTAPITGNYKLEVWGASGGNTPSGLGSGIYGKGGYSIGYKSLNSSNSLYVCVGSHGNDNSSVTGGTGGYNGGGKGGDGNVNAGGGGGGGATHIAFTTNRGVLKNYKDYYQTELLLVAGGGGGKSLHSIKTGFGGGLNGGDAINHNNTYTLSGATQTTGYAFGQGQNGNKKTGGQYGAEGNGGGGGGFYGGLASLQDGNHSCCGGAGGSGYVGSVTNGETIAGDQTFPSPNGGIETGHDGDGYCIISWISPNL